MSILLLAAPSGLVSFYDNGSTLLGTAPLSNSRASFAVTTLGGGTHHLTAVFQGTSPVLPSRSNAVSQLVYGLTASGAASLSAHVGNALSGALVATFTDDDPNPAVHHYSATIDWGDSTTSTGAISATGASSFAVRGTHTYSSAGPRTSMVTIRAMIRAGVSTRTTTSAAVARGRSDMTASANGRGVWS